MKCIKTLVAIVGFLALMPLSQALAETKLDCLIAKENTLLAGIEKMQSSIEKSIKGRDKLEEKIAEQCRPAESRPAEIACKRMVAVLDKTNRRIQNLERNLSKVEKTAKKLASILNKRLARAKNRIRQTTKKVARLANSIRKIDKKIVNMTRFIEMYADSESENMQATVTKRKEALAKLEENKQAMTEELVSTQGYLEKQKLKMPQTARNRT